MNYNVNNTGSRQERYLMKLHLNNVEKNVDELKIWEDLNILDVETLDSGISLPLYTSTSTKTLSTDFTAYKIGKGQFVLTGVSTNNVWLFIPLVRPIKINKGEEYMSFYKFEVDSQRSGSSDTTPSGPTGSMICNGVNNNAQHKLDNSDSTTRLGNGLLAISKISSTSEIAEPEMDYLAFLIPSSRAYDVHPIKISVELRKIKKA